MVALEVACLKNVWTALFLRCPVSLATQTLKLRCQDHSSSVILDWSVMVMTLTFIAQCLLNAILLFKNFLQRLVFFHLQVLPQAILFQLEALCFLH